MPLWLKMCIQNLDVKLRLKFEHNFERKPTEATQAWIRLNRILKAILCKPYNLTHGH